MTLHIENLIATVCTREGFQSLLDTQERFIADSARILPDILPNSGETGVAHDIPDLFREESGCGAYFSPYFTINGFLTADDWVNEFEDALSVGLTILKHAKEFNDGGNYFLEIVSERTEVIDDWGNDDDEDEDDCMEDYAETETHLFRIALNSNDEIVIEHGRNSPDSQYPPLTLTGDPTEFIKKEFSRYA